MTFMARLLHTPPSRFSRPSTVPLEVAASGEEEEGEEEGREGGGGRGGRGKMGEFRTKKREDGRDREREDDTVVNEHVHNTQD